MASILAFITSNLNAANIALVLSVILSIVRVAEKLFPNASALKSADQSLSAVGAKDVDGQ